METIFRFTHKNAVKGTFSAVLPNKQIYSIYGHTETEDLVTRRRKGNIISWNALDITEVKICYTAVVEGILSTSDSKHF